MAAVLYVSLCLSACLAVSLSGCAYPSSPPVGSGKNAAPDPRWEDRVIGLIADVGFSRDLDGGYFWSDIERLEGEGARATVYTLKRKRELPSGVPVGRITIAPLAQALPGETVSRSFVIRSELLASDEAIARILFATARSIANHDDGTFYDPPRAESLVRRGSYFFRSLSRATRYVTVLFACMAALAAVLVIRRKLLPFRAPLKP